MAIILSNFRLAKERFLGNNNYKTYVSTKDYR